MSHYIALGSIFIECNHFGGIPADLESFRRSELFYGGELLTRTGGTVGGMLEVLRHSQSRIAPLLVASACPSGPVTHDCYQQLKDDLLARLARALPVDGVLLALHGAAAVEKTGDLEGDLLEAVRAAVGDAVPVVATLDLHAHVTAKMMTGADALLAWETYPHRDAFETGQRGARALLDILDRRLKPTMALAKVPVVVSALQGHTEGPGPFADVMRLAKSFENRPGVYSASAFMAHPNLDFPDMGGGGLVVTNDNQELARSLAGEIAMLYWNKRDELETPVFTPAEAIAQGLAIDGGPVLLIEAADCCGGGAAGDSAAVLTALLKTAPDSRSLVPIVDPRAAARCHQADVGATVSLRLGHAIDPQWGSPVPVTGIVEKLSDGRFTYRGGIWDAQAGNMGPTARLAVGGIQILVASHATYDWRSEQYDLLEMEPRSAKFVVAKNPMNYRMVYRPFARGEFVLDTPGPTPATLRNLRYQNRQRPYFPTDRDIPGLVPAIVTGHVLTGLSK